MSKTIVLVFTSRIKVKNIVLVATSSVKVLSISRLLGSQVLPTVAATHTCTRTSSPASPEATQMPSFHCKGWVALHIQAIQICPHLLIRQRASPSLYMCQTGQQRLRSIWEEQHSRKSQTPWSRVEDHTNLQQEYKLTNTSGEGVYTPGYIRSRSMVLGVLPESSIVLA